ncbi:2-C-methyl-D-erythritol 4-phosphate cytidylyltransferase [Candidatus Hepatincolaceae symbiont of Richtersius coronifer]
MGRNIAVLLAAGEGNRLYSEMKEGRLNSNIPKQFININGKTSVEYCLEAFRKHKEIDEICIVINQKWQPLLTKIIDTFPYKNINIIAGGVERYHSSYNAILEYQNDDYLLFHDAARPLVSYKIINETLKALKNYACVASSIPVANTIIEVNLENTIAAFPPRNLLQQLQTPQAFKREIIKRAYDIGLQDANFTTTDDCGVIFKYLPKEKIHLIPGEIKNYKLTYADDIALICQYLQQLKV